MRSVMNVKRQLTSTTDMADYDVVTREVYEAHVNVIEELQSQLSSHDMVIIAGDFNLLFTLIHIIFQFIGESNNERALLAKFVTTSLLEGGLFQLNNIQTVSGNVLDLVYTNSPELVVVNTATNRLIGVHSSDEAHNPLLIEVESEPKIYLSNDNSEPIFCFRKANFDQLNEELLSYDFHIELADMSVDTMLQRFYEILYTIFNKCVPKSSLRKSKKSCLVFEETVQSQKCAK